ncbi:meiotically up-regulated gene 113-domain-containing protein [Amylocarpus encephaloides]|uniref:Meiotically up-regulated gene 113-domain-containing protein n=1 Tax=Amylocarpus encephaloides TaxID=45428 RepID=A0A9P7YT31_9HELO|nr:meiotically up-regulated gene 113-domain-containing protein [Amylocarpus encephaloides]
MPFIANTPESLLSRSDSKNPAATCRGLTSNGRSCRRAISVSPRTSPSPTPNGAISPQAFCWQHQEQASAHNTPTPSPRRKQDTIRERTSVDTLVDRLGLLEVAQKQGRKSRQQVSQSGRSEKPGNGSAPTHLQAPSSQQRRRPKPKQRSALFLLCCIGEEDGIISSARPVNTSNRPANSTTQSGRGTRTSVPTSKSHRPAIARDPSSRTGEFLSLIPLSTSPQTTSLLLLELAKPFSERDDEGFIYMFWLTPESLSADAPSQAASSLLAPPPRPDPGRRRASDVLNTYAAATPDTSSKKTMLLKIGRAQNVQRRLNQWTRQCGYNVSLIRYYPYQSGTPINENTPPRTPSKVPNVNKVERLIHLELADMKAKGDAKCSTCGREHREWFEVDASRDGVKAVDEIIRRWVEWGEREVKR